MVWNEVGEKYRELWHEPFLILKRLLWFIGAG